MKPACSAHRVDGVDQLAGLAELHEALSEVIEGSFHKNLLLLVVVEQIVPKRLLGERLGVPHNDHTIPSLHRQSEHLIRALQLSLSTGVHEFRRVLEY